MPYCRLPYCRADPMYGSIAGAVWCPSSPSQLLSFSGDGTARVMDANASGPAAIVVRQSYDHTLLLLPILSCVTTWGIPCCSGQILPGESVRRRRKLRNCGAEIVMTIFGVVDDDPCRSTSKLLYGGSIVILLYILRGTIIHRTRCCYFGGP